MHCKFNKTVHVYTTYDTIHTLNFKFKVTGFFAGFSQSAHNILSYNNQMTKAKEDKKDGKASLWSCGKVIQPQHVYIRLCVENERLKAVPYHQIGKAIDEALLMMYGHVGSSVLHYQVVDTKHLDGFIVLRTPESQHQRICAALTLFPGFRSMPVRFTVMKSTPYVFALFDNQTC